MDAYLRPLVSYPLYVAIIGHKKKILEKSNKLKRYSQKNFFRSNCI